MVPATVRLPPEMANEPLLKVRALLTVVAAPSVRVPDVPMIRFLTVLVLKVPEVMVYEVPFNTTVPAVAMI